MKAKTIALIGLLAFGGFITLSCIVNQIDSGQLPDNGPRPVTAAEWDALAANARIMMGRTFVVNDVAVDLDLVELQCGPLGIDAAGYYMSPEQPSVAVVVDQYLVTFSRFAGGTVLGNANAVLDAAHRCIIYYHNGAYVALVIE